MKNLLRQLHPLHALAVALMVLPVLAIFALGLLWLWQAQMRWPWLAAFSAAILSGYVLQAVLVRHDRRLLAEAATESNPDWPTSAESVWQRIETLADGVEPDDWPLDDPARLLALGRLTLESVALAYHPNAGKPLLELTVPHTLLIIERASRDLRHDIADHIPFSHRLTIGDLLRVHRWKASADRAFNLYRAGRLVVNPVDALISEVRKHILGRSLGLGRIELHRWLLRAYVHKVGYYAIDLYSGRLPLDDAAPTASHTATSRADLEQASATASAADEPLRIVVFGRANAGKSSLVNALFGKLAAVTDVLADTTASVTPFALVREGFTEALIFDTPGCDSELFNRDMMQRVAADADLILWVSAVNRPDRHVERDRLDALRAFLAGRGARRPPPLLVAASHIDQLRPANEWQPPYDLVNPQGVKATHIRAAVEAVATDLAVPVEQVIPVCLADGRVYNVDDALWAALLEQQQSALRSRLLRCLEARKRTENWDLLRRQLIGAGRFLRDLPARFTHRQGR